MEFFMRIAAKICRTLRIHAPVIWDGAQYSCWCYEEAD